LDALFARSDVTTVMIVPPGVTLPSAHTTYEIPADKTLAVVGDLDLGSYNYTIYAYEGTLDLTSGRLTNGDAGDIIILNDDNKTAVAGKIVGAAAPLMLQNGIPGTGSPGGPAMIQTLTLSTPADVTALNTYMTSNRLYVLENLTVNAASAFASTAVTVFGDTTAGVAITLNSATNPTLQGKLIAGDDITITGLEYFTGTLDISSYEVEADADAVDLAHLDGSGTLELSHAALAAVSIGSGTGNAAVNVTGATPDFTSGASFGNTGLTTFDNDVAVTAGTITFAGDVDFDGALIFTAGGASFGGAATFGGAVSGSDAAVTFVGLATFNDTFATTSGAATFQNGAVFEDTAGFGGDATITGDVTFGGAVATGGATIIDGIALFDEALTLFAGGGDITFKDDVTFTAAKVVTTGTGAITLEAGKKLVVGADDVITADGADVVLTPSAASTTLTFAAKKITQAAGNIKIGGSATLAAGTEYVVDGSRTLTVDTAGTLTVDGTLDIGAGLILTGSSSDGAILNGTVAVGDSSIAGGWQAVAVTTGNVTIAADAITVAASTKLTGMDAGSIIAVLDTKQLSVTGQIDISTAGAVTLEGGSITSASILLTSGVNAGSLLVDGDNDTSVVIDATITVSNFYLIDASGTVATSTVILKDMTPTAVTGGAASNIAVLGSGANASGGGVDLGAISAGSSDNAVIVGPGDGQTSTITNGWKVVAPHS
jgi:hypothetical protein